jgi:hypothetical protein
VSTLPSYQDLRDRLWPTPDPWLADPAGWVRSRLSEHLWSKQVEILESVRDHRRTAVHSCHGAGKSHIAARVAAWWLECHPPGTAFVVSTAPSWPQVRAILWRYIGQVHRKGGLIGRVNQTEWFIGSEQVGYGRKPPDNDEEGFQGIHAKYVLVLVDEAAGIPPALWKAILALLTTAECRVLAIGNPDYEGSEFSKMCSPASSWNAIHIDGLQTPNFSGEHVPRGTPLLDHSYVDDVVADYGVDSPTYMAKVRGLFPSDRTDGVVPWSWVLKAKAEEALAELTPLRVPIELGVDVGGGTDLTVIRERTGPVAGRRWSVNTEDSEEIVDEIITTIRVTGAEAVKIDYGGIGFGVTGSLKRRVLSEVAHQVRVVPVEFGGKAKDDEKYENARAEMWWEARLHSKDRTWHLGATDEAGKALVDERTIADLIEPRWFENKRGRIQVEDKDGIRKRLGRSPDDGDALALAFYEPRAEAGGVEVTEYRNEALRGSR